MDMYANGKSQMIWGKHALLPRPAKAVFSRLGFLFGFTVAFWMGAMPSSSAEPAADKYFIEFSTDANLEGLTVNYAITGRAGGIGIRISDRVKSPAYSVDVSTAKTLKAIVMSPHYKTVLIDAPDLGKDGPRRTKVELEPLANVPFKGHIVMPKDVDPEKFRLEILYCASWGMGYFGYIDGSPPCFVAGQADIRPDGSFEAALPDMTHDPVMGNHKDDGSNLILILRHKKSGNLLFRLLQEKDGLDANLLRIEDRYEFIELRAVKD